VKSGVEADTFVPVDVGTYMKAGTSVICVVRGAFLNKLAPGAYRLEVRAGNDGGKSTAWRSAEFVVKEAAPLNVGEF